MIDIYVAPLLFPWTLSAPDFFHSRIATGPPFPLKGWATVAQVP